MEGEGGGALGAGRGNDVDEGAVEGEEGDPV